MLALLAVLGGVSGCSGGATCSPGTGTPMLVAQLFFGLAVPGRSDVTDREWAGFVDQVAAAALPDGFTVLDGDGGWMNPATRVTSRERSKVLVVALPDTAERIAALNGVREAYQRAFHQQLVGMTVVRECASF